ncbi:penicillin acylase family protein [Amycolatopsis suaedae]|uniref:Penicillin acylase family protein n=1 Tax=Amycolatopsis suaedae TaxID=2510978 RepID=A0A4Q7J180_9PSEU|nr:penicillin acylase family protein [Amycolatopsis suaedae]RZQ60579.1 penicillin acylase family protein [Amycolatopsis suaedae]
MRRLVTLLLVLSSLTAVATAPASAASPTVHRVAGLERPVRLVVDTWGVPHIYALTTGDAFLAQGFNAARDRLFQLDLWLRKGTGRLAEVFGESYVEQDRASRLFLYRGDMEREWAAYGPEGRAAATRFATGVNAYLDWLQQNPGALPVEFQKLNYRPARWTPEDVVRIRTHGLSRNLHNEVTRSRTTCAAGPAADRFRVHLQPAHQPAVPAGLDPCSLPADLLTVFELATSPPYVLGGPSGSAMAPQGSNNWVVSPSRTTTGRPILADDPHRGMFAPSVRYLAHVSGPEFDVIGAGEPFAPGISIGHNGTASFGLTVSEVDQEDLYVYELDPADPDRYRYGDGWEDIRTVTEQVPVAGGTSRPVTLRFTRHGPVIKAGAGRAYAVRAAWLEPGGSPYYGSLSYLRAKNFGQFHRALDNWNIPTVNHVYADTSGTTAWAVAGLAPRRKGYDGLYPVPGDGRYEWDGFVSKRELPRTVDPREGFFATANDFNIPPDHPHHRGLSYEWSNPSRHQRISEVLRSRPKSSVADSAALQNDQLSIPARRLLALLAPLSSDDPDTAAALAVLNGWNAVTGPESGPAALFENWFSGPLGHHFLRAAAPKELLPLVPVPDHQVLLDAMENPLAWFGPDGVRIRDGVLLGSLAEAFRATRERLGADPATWRWGELQHTMFWHPLAGQDPALRVGPLPRGGSWYTVDISHYLPYPPFGYRQFAGASFRMVLDVGNWDASLAINAPGQSGDPRSPGYRALAEKWRTGQYFPLLYSRAEVERNAAQRIILLPAR